MTWIEKNLNGTIEFFTQDGIYLLAVVGAIPIIYLFEYFIPADSKQKRFGAHVTQDVVYFGLVTVFGFTILVWYIYLFEYLYNEYFSFLAFRRISQTGYWTKFILGILLVDFLQWFHHWFRHKVPLLWHFHTVHHSQRKMNMFTDFRYHIFEYLVTEPISIIPFFILGFSPPRVIAFVIFTKVLTLFYHSNIKTNLGPLRYILVTPQYHRIHHSIEPEHQDKNFAVIFSFWDRLFGTQHEDEKAYPNTGIRDETFPLETTSRGLGVAQTTLDQFIYSFRAII